MKLILKNKKKQPTVEIDYTDIGACYAVTDDDGEVIIFMVVDSSEAIDAINMVVCIGGNMADNGGCIIGELWNSTVVRNHIKNYESKVVKIRPKLYVKMKK